MSDAEREELRRLREARQQRTEFEERQELRALRDRRDKGESSPWSDFWEGVALSGMSTMYGVKDLVGALDENERKTYEQVKQDASDSGWTTAGKVVGELGQLAVPAGAVTKGARAITAAPGLARTAAMLAGESAAAGGLGYLKLPEQGQTRTERAVRDALFAGGGGAAGIAGAKMIRGLSKTREAQKLLDEGVYLTPGKQAQSEFIQNVETAMEVTPVLARGTKKAQERGMREWNKNVLQKAAPRGANITEIGTEGGRQLKQAVKEGYDDAWKGVKPVKKVVRDRLGARLTAAGRGLGKKDRRVIDNVVKDLSDMSSAKKIDAVLRREISVAGTKRRELRLALEKLRRDMRTLAPKTNRQKLRRMDEQYPAYLVAEDALTRAKQTGGVFTPQQLMTSAGRVGRKSTAVGDAPLQDAATVGIATVGKKVGGQPLDFFRRLASAAPSPPFMQPAGEFLMGNTRGQRALVEALTSPRVDALRAVISPERAGYLSGQYLDED